MDYGNHGVGDQYSTTYGAQGGADGGGFLGGEGGSSPAGGKQEYGKDTVRPITVKQAISATQAHPDADHKIDGESVSKVTFVGQIRSISSQPTNTTYKVDDGTGIVEVKQWMDPENASQDEMDMSDSAKPKLVENGYCRVWGQLKTFGVKRHVGAHFVRPITDFNEVNYHLLEAAAIHLFFTRGLPSSETTNGANGPTTNDMSASGGAQGNVVNGRTMPPVSRTAWKVYETLKDSHSSNEGLHVQMLASQLGLQVNDVYKVAEELVSSGYIFTTVDDHTWAVLEY